MTPRGFVLRELLVLCLIGAIVLALSAISAHGARIDCRRLTDADSQRLIVQSLAGFSLAAGGEYPRPSVLDSANRTVARQGISKDTTDSVVSLLIFNGLISPELCVSSNEISRSVTVLTDYQYDRPIRAVNRDLALWDPGFAATPNDVQEAKYTPGRANQSYAYSIPVGLRLGRWANTGSPDQAVVSNRGPTYVGTTPPAGGDWQLTDDVFGVGSITLRFFAPLDRWSGNVGFNDGRVVFATSPTPPGATYDPVGPVSAVPDNIFVDETDEEPGVGDTTNVGVRSNALLKPVSRLSPVGDGAFAQFWMD